MRLAHEGLPKGLAEEVLDSGLNVMHYPDQPIATSRGTAWITKYEVPGDITTSEMLIAHVSRLGAIEKAENYDCVWMNWTARSHPSNLPYLMNGIPAAENWVWDEPKSRRQHEQSNEENLTAGTIAVRSYFSAKGRAKILIKFPLRTSGISDTVELLADRTVDYPLVEHLPEILEREHDLLLY